jgi:rhodanese-related sulfurtransferase
MDIAVPANLRCGQPDDRTVLPQEPTWAPLTCRFSGIWEIQPTALQEQIAGKKASEIQIVDVREPSEFSDSLGHIRGARLLPLSELAARIGEIAADRPVVTVCRSGARSAQATVLLQKAGFNLLANLAGGMLRWRAESLPVEQGAE